jgi:hypothetical protein
MVLFKEHNPKRKLVKNNFENTICSNTAKSNTPVVRLRSSRMWCCIVGWVFLDEWVWSIGGMILTGENWSTGRETLYSVGGRCMNEYGALVVDGWMSMEHWWNDTDRGNWSTGGETLYSVGGRCMNEYGTMVEWYWQGKLKGWKQNLSQCHFVNHKSHMNWPVIEQGASETKQTLATDRVSHGTPFKLAHVKCQVS